ncbi:RagB/SusD family nutrient uptake outer membrane protein [Pedobacter frigoris]|uniref:RagB/SusD family nutrient uptake outer membrane protein n=1 Tax=Pedobacter frigoris TaxID=2571272 RepID=UPI00292ED171|nr:RagB/SusD family nutrient uptake outer membrane protein [Pedobacter frigoris]
MEKYKRILWSIVLLMFLFAGCKKYLDVRSDSKLVIPQTLPDLQALLDTYTKINRTDASAAEVSSDDYFVKDADYNSVVINQRRLYTWEKDNVFAEGSNDWANAYDKIYIANTVLDNLKEITVPAGQQMDWNNVKGQALFLRANSLFQLALTFSLAYDETTADTDLGIPLRLTGDLDEKISRATVRQSYTQIVNDLKEAEALLPAAPVHVFRSSKAAACGLLARVYLAMRKYEECLVYAGECLKIKSTLLNYNTPNIPNPATSFPFSATVLQYNNPEIIYASSAGVPTILANTRSKIVADLYASYLDGDLRKTIFFTTNTGTNAGTNSFKGSYEGNGNLFVGLATNEVYFMRAECFARKNMPVEAMNDVNAVLSKRWRTGAAYVNLAAANGKDALAIVLKERRKELLMRTLRWMDIKRLNKEGANIVLQRLVNGVTYTLPPNDLRYALAIPESIIAINKIPQNRR